MIERLSLREFSTLGTAAISFAPGLNVIIGENGSGKTHLMKAAYALSSTAALKRAGGAYELSLSLALTDLFKPADGKLLSLRTRGAERSAALTADFSSGRRVSALIDASTGALTLPDDNYPRNYTDDPTFIPSREVLSFLRGFAGLYSLYELPFDRTYRDLAMALDLPKVRDDKLREPAKRMITVIERVCGGRFDFRGGGHVVLAASDGDYSTASVSEAAAHLGTLARLLENGSIRPGESGPIFWEHPETNMDPKLQKVIAGIALELSRAGAQVIITTHSYILLKYIQLLSEPNDVRYHSLSRADDGSIKISSVDRFEMLGANALTSAFANLYDIESGRIVVDAEDER